jgi:glutamine amidotransferase
MIAIVDCGIGNTGSIANMLRKCGVEHAVTKDPAEVARADRLILPGVGSFAHGMQRLRASGLLPVLEDAVLGQGRPILGICLGMQFLGKGSEEGGEAGLGWLDAETVRFRIPDSEPGLKVPHMGWNTLARAGEARGLESLNSDARFYFVHSYHVVCRDPADIFATTRHGCEFVSAVKRGHLTGVQFHPEKSHRFGLTFLRDFATS